MSHITIEYMIMVPVLILQIFIFPFAASAIMNVWVDQRKTLELQEVSGHLGSFMQQIYYTMNHVSISTGTLTAKLDTPPLIENYAYTIILQNATNPNNSVKIMNLTLSLIGTNNHASTLVTLGENAAWQENSTYNSIHVSIITASKTSSTISLSFEGDT
jgi:hypothetical protein